MLATLKLNFGIRQNIITQAIFYKCYFGLSYLSEVFILKDIFCSNNKYLIVILLIHLFYI